MSEREIRSTCFVKAIINPQQVIVNNESDISDRA